MKLKLKNIFLTTCILLGVSGCGLPTGSSGGEKENVTTVKMIQAEVFNSELNGEERNLRNIKRLNDSSSTSTLEDESSTELDSSSSETEVTDPIVDGPQFVIIYKDETDVTLTITLDNPEAHGIDALRVSCDDPEAKIQVEGEWKPIAQEADGTRVVNWSSEDPYEKTYNIRTTSLEDLYTFKVVDIRLAGHSTFLSKQTKSNDFGNNKLDIYKMDTDAYELDVVYNTFEEIKFGIKVKDSVNNLSNFKVDGKLPDEEGYWVMNESKNNCEISYDFELENGVKIRRESNVEINLLSVNLGLHKISQESNIYMANYDFIYSGPLNMIHLDNFDEQLSLMNTNGYFEVRMFISGTSATYIPEMWIGDVKLENVTIARSYIDELPYFYYCIMPEFDCNDNNSLLMEMSDNFRFKVGDKFYKINFTNSDYRRVAMGYMED